MQKQICEDCGYRFAPWDTVYLWPEGRETVCVCPCCMEARVNEMSVQDLAEQMGVRGYLAEELAK